MLPSPLLCVGLAADVTGVDVTATLGAGAGVSPSSSVIFGVPLFSLHADVVLDESWYVGGGVVGFTFIDPQFLLLEDPLSRGVLDGTARVGFVFLHSEATQIRGDLGVLLGAYENDPEDAPPGIYLYPSLGAVIGVRAEWTIARGAFAHVGATGTVILAPFGLIEIVPMATIGGGWRF